jgi:hypothetical protein
MPTRRSAPTSRRSRLAALGSISLSLVAAALLAACADGPSAPAAAPRSAQLDRIAPPVAVSGLLRDNALAQDITVQETIGPEGGVLQISAAGLTLEVPAGAVNVPTVFSATALAGRAVAYDFGPSGQFPVALTVKQDLKGTNWKKAQVEGLVAGYVRDLRSIDRASANARSDELRPATLDANGGKIEFTVTHFSGYMISTGRCFWGGGDDY